MSKPTIKRVKAKRSASRSYGSTVLACVWCGTGTRNRVRGHAACFTHEEVVDRALASNARAADEGVVTTIDYDPKSHRQRMGTVHVRAAQGAVGGRVVLDVYEGDRDPMTAYFMVGNVLRADGARALAGLLLAAADKAEKFLPLGEPAEADRAPAKAYPGTKEG